MTRREAVMIAALSLIWGSSFMFIKVADREFDPAALVFFRLLFASAVVVPVAFVVMGRNLLAQARPVWGRLVVLGLVNTTIPFLLISWAETRLDSGLAAILQAAAPIFSAVIATRFGNDPVTGYRLAGVLVGLAGVALLVGSPGRGGLLAALAVVLAALAYASAASFGSHVLVGTPPLVVAAVSTTAAMIAVAPLGLARLPGAVPGWKESGSVVVLGIVGTGIAYIILFALLRTAGPSRTILITYLIPGWRCCTAFFCSESLCGRYRWAVWRWSLRVSRSRAAQSRRHGGRHRQSSPPAPQTESLWKHRHTHLRPADTGRAQVGGLGSRP